MSTTDARDADAESELAVPDARVSAHQTCPGRFVFTENGNVDGWIATDCTVSLER